MIYKVLLNVFDFALCSLCYDQNQNLTDRYPQPVGSNPRIMRYYQIYNLKHTSPFVFILNDIFLTLENNGLYSFTQVNAK